VDATAAERQRRYRARQKAHRAGDHALCADPDKCAEPAVTPSRVTAVTRNAGDYGVRGARLWQEMSGDKLTGGPRTLLEEACRIADRLDKLAGIDSGDLEGLLRFKLSDDGTDVTVTVDSALSEARQQALALKQIIAELRQTATPAGRRRPAPPSGGASVAAGVADLTTRIRDRRAQAQG
jgi:hypothetical protein